MRDAVKIRGLERLGELNNYSSLKRAIAYHGTQRKDLPMTNDEYERKLATVMQNHYVFGKATD